MRVDPEQMRRVVINLVDNAVEAMERPGDMTLENGLVTGAIGLNNAGALRIGAGPGIVSVDRFQTTGVWAVQIGG